MTESGKCRVYCEHLSDYLDGEVESCTCREIEEHLRECPPCALVYESLKTTVEICGKGVSDSVPEEVRQRLRDYLRANCRELVE